MTFSLSSGAADSGIVAEVKAAPRPAIRHPVPSDLAWIDDALDEWPCTVRWDVKGHSPSLPSLLGRLWDGVVTQRVVIEADGQPSALFQLIDVDLVDGAARVEAIARREDAVAEAWCSFLAEVAESMPLRTVDVVAVADSFRVESVDRTAREVGRLPDRHWRGSGRFADVVIHSIELAREERRFVGKPAPAR